MGIRELINSIKIRPKMFVAEVQLDYIFHFLLGYPIEFDFIWYRMIEKVTNSEQEAAELFFKLSEEFFNYYEKSEEKKELI